VEVSGNGTLLRKVPTPGTTGAGGNPPGESPSNGAETTQPDDTVMAMRRRFRRELVKRPSPWEQALTDGRKLVPRPSRRARSRMLPEPEWGLLLRPGRLVEEIEGRRPWKATFRAGKLADVGPLNSSQTLSPNFCPAPFGPPP